MFTTPDSVERIRANCLATDCLIVGNQQGDLLALCQAVEPHLANADPSQVNKLVCRDTILGVRRSPAGVELYHETPSLLAVLDAYDLLVAPPQPDPATPEVASGAPDEPADVPADVE